MSPKRLFNTLLFVFLASSSPSFSQSIKWSSELKDNNKMQYMLILGANDEGNFYVLRSNMSLDNKNERSGFRNRSYMLQFFTAELSLKWEKEIKTSYEDGHISDLQLINNKIIVTSYLYDKKSKIYYFYTQRLDDNGKWEGEPFALDNIASQYMDENNKPQLINSHDQTLIAFSYRKIEKESKTQSYNVILLDTNFIVKYKKEIAVSYAENIFVPTDFAVSNQGSFYILGIHYLTEKKVKAPDQSFYELYGYNNLLQGVVNKEIKIENKFLTDVGLSIDNINKSIVAAGFYSEKSLYSTAGVFYYSISEDSLKETKTINSPFSPEYLQQFLNDKKENRELVNYSIDHLKVRKDGGVGIIAESYYESNRSYFDYYMQSYISHYYYHYGNVMVLSINPDGKILWNNVITKDQNSIDDNGYYSSYYCAVTGGRLVAIYNKYIEDASSVLISYIDAGGNQNTSVLFNEIDKITIIPQSGKQIDDETLILPAYKQNKFYLVQITFD